MQAKRPDTTINGCEFACFMTDHPEEVVSCLPLTVRHRIHGVGDVSAVTPRVGMVPLFDIVFASNNRALKFNLDAFKSGVFPELEVSTDLLERLRMWRKDVKKRAKKEREQAREIELKAALEKLNQAMASLRAITERLEVQAEERAKELLENSRDIATRIIPFHEHLASISENLSAMELMDRECNDRLKYNRKVIHPRIDWLDEWASRISGGEKGLEPQWSVGQSAAKYLKEKGINHLWHFTDIRNLDNIRKVRGLLSYEGVEALVLPDSEVFFSASSESIRRDTVLGRQNSVRLSFIPNSFFFQRAQKCASLVWMRFSLSALSLGEVFYSRGNAASYSSDLFHRPENLGIDWELAVDYGNESEFGCPPLFYPKRYPRSSEGPERVLYDKCSMNSEVLINHFLSLKFCTGVWDVNGGEWIDFSQVSY